jgi:hypothetical protein
MLPTSGEQRQWFENTMLAFVPRSHSEVLPACLGNENSNRLVSLWDIVNQFDLLALAVHITAITHASADFQASGPGLQDANIDQPLKEALVAELRDFRGFCRNAGFGSAALKIQRTLDRLEADPALSSRAWLSTELANVVEWVCSDAGEYQFLRVSRDRSKYVDHPALFGTDVNAAFPSAAPDIRDAGNCLAAECNTAAVFHLMRAVEWGLRALCVDLGFRRVRRQKSGRVTYVPLAWNDWETLLNQLESRVADSIQKTRRGPKKQLFQEFYLPAIQDIKAIKEAWRNHVMHTRREYTREDADAILSHVRRLMVQLASRITE